MPVQMPGCFTAAALLAFLLVPLQAAPPAPPPPRDLNSLRWPAVWVCEAGAPREDYGVFHFRKTFTLSEQPTSFRVRVTADNRYRLFVNGVDVGHGPARGDPLHWRYDTIDLAPYLRPGSNVLAAQVWNAGESKPWAQMSVRTGFLLQGETPAEDVVNTGPSWRVTRNPAYSAEPIDRAAMRAFFVVGDGDRIDGSKYPWGWEQLEFDDSRWSPATRAAYALPFGAGSGIEWWLVPNQLPAMEQTPVRFAEVRRATGPAVPTGLLRGAKPLLVPPQSRARFLLDQGHETNAYPVLVVSGGRGSEVRLTYAEALVDGAGRKGNRNEIDGRTLIGNRDVFLPDGQPQRRFTTLWFRTYRYVEVEITTGSDPLTLHDISGIFTGFPFIERGRFTSDDPQLQQIWAVGWRTARLCAHETYFDCPYYEQLQYVGDTRIQALISLYVAGDDRLVRNAIEQYDHSRISEGLTQGRYPSDTPQIINTFSLFWINMVHDYWMHRDDPAFVRARLMGVRNVLEWFSNQIDPASGLVGPLPDWAFVDWTEAWRPTNGRPGGVPPAARTGNSAIISLQLAYTLRHAAELHRALGEPELGNRYAAAAEALNRRVMELCWDEKRQLVAEAPDRKQFSQHANALAVLSGAITGADARALMERTVAEPGLVACSYYFRFYLLRAMKAAGLGDRYVAEMTPWREMLAQGLTTFAERPEPTRSDCHAWSASPCYELLATVLGVEPAAPGFRRVRIAPHPGPLTQLSGRVPVPEGEIDVSLTRRDSDWLAVVVLPAGLPGELVWGGETHPLRAGSQELSLKGPASGVKDAGLK